MDKLRAHEEIIEGAAEKLAKQMLNEGVVRDPLIVDQETLVILDGMHRFHSLQLLGCRFAPCNLVDYGNPQIEVHSWFRVSFVEEAESTAERLLRENGLDYSKELFASQELKFDAQTIILTSEGTRFQLSNAYSAIEHARVAVRLERELESMGCKVDYLPDLVAMKQLISGNVSLVISLPVFTKQQIQEMALRGVLLPHKTTRHIVFSRPLHVNVPLQLLLENRLSESDANRQLRELLSKSRVERKPPGSLFDGRRYDEDLFVFST